MLAQEKYLVMCLLILLSFLLLHSASKSYLSYSRMADICQEMPKYYILGILHLWFHRLSSIPTRREMSFCNKWAVLFSYLWLFLNLGTHYRKYVKARTLFLLNNVSHNKPQYNDGSFAGPGGKAFSVLDWSSPKWMDQWQAVDKPQEPGRMRG